MYKAKEPIFLWLLLLLISLVYALFLHDLYRMIAFLVAALLAMIMFSSYKLTIHEKGITFLWYIVGIKVINREVPASSMKRITFITTSRQTIALVHLHKGLRLKLHRFKPSGYIDELRTFASKHQVDTEETNFLKQDQ